MTLHLGTITLAAETGKSLEMLPAAIPHIERGSARGDLGCCIFQSSRIVFSPEKWSR